MPAPQTNVSLEDMARRMKEYDQFVLCGHVNPDGDCLGSQLALSLALRSLGKRVTNVLVNPDSIERGLRFLPGASDMIAAEDYEGPVQAFIACDVPVVSRIGAAARLQRQAQVTFTVDHHASDAVMSEYNYIEPEAPACGMLVWSLIKELGVVPSPEMALCCYTALMTDTGRFQYQNTTSEAFRFAMEMIDAGADPALASQEAYQRRSFASLKLEEAMLSNMRMADSGVWVMSHVTLADFTRFGAVKADAEPLINVLRSLDGVSVACILREHEECVRGSLRAKDDVIDVSALARRIGGGGHKAAAGFTFEGTLEEALGVIPGMLDEFLSESAGA